MRVSKKAPLIWLSTSIVGLLLLAVGGVAIANQSRLVPAAEDPSDGIENYKPADPDVESPIAGLFGERPPVLDANHPEDLDRVSGDFATMAAAVPDAIGVLDMTGLAISEEHSYRSVTVLTESGDAVTISHQTYDPAWDVTDLVEPGDVLSVWDDGSDVIVRDRRPTYIQILVITDTTIGSVVIEKRPGDGGAEVIHSLDDAIAYSTTAMRNVGSLDH